MSTSAPHDESLVADTSGETAARGGEYIVVARRYRPKTFDELVGQRQVSQALANAIETNRVGHAYLFAGARGVGKTSAARIFAKALNCVTGPTPIPCNECDICRSVASGEDVDVLEIDGASNRGIDEIRQLRSNVNIRPSRSRLKIYIIDEVHMLTPPAFNALLKTLEEPPEHVKFIFCTTDPEKIPITVLSRCQRFDFVGIRADAIVQRLQQIAEAEGAQVEREALTLLARRATGSMRDSQSLLEQLLAFGGDVITVDDVHAMLGTARGGQLGQLVAQLIDRNTTEALVQLDAAFGEGVDPGQLVEQLLGHFRDIMAATVGCRPELMLHTLADEYESLVAASRRLGLTTILAIVQILDHTVIRMRQSAHARTLAEMALVRICTLEDLEQIPSLIAQLESGGITVASARANSAPNRSAVAEPANRRVADPPQTPGDANPVTSTTAPPSGSGGTMPATAQRPLTAESAREIWDQTLADLGGVTADSASYCASVSPQASASSNASAAISAPNTLVVSFPAKYTSHKSYCERPEQRARLEEALGAATGMPVKLEFRTLPDDSPSQAAGRPVVSPRQRMREASEHPMVRQAMELFDGEVIRVEEPRHGEGQQRAGEGENV